MTVYHRPTRRPPVKGALPWAGPPVPDAAPARRPQQEPQPEIEAARLFAWQEAANCASVGPDRFYSDQKSGGAALTAAQEAQTVCANCDVWQTCRYFGLGEEYGTWGGISSAGRRRLRHTLGVHAEGWYGMEGLRAELYRAYAQAGYVVEVAIANDPRLADSPLMWILEEAAVA